MANSGATTPTDHQEAVSRVKSLDARATPALYRANAFRITGLPVDATARDIARRRERLQAREKLGIAVAQVNGVFRLEPPPDAHAIQEAEHRLRDPERRLVEEFFWFWPMEGGSSRQDEALAALQQGDIGTAAAHWMRQESQRDGGVPTHNLAVLAHLAALDLEHLAQNRPLTDRERQRRDTYWEDAFGRWKALLNQEAFWSRLTTRIRELDDPSLTTGISRRIHSTLPLALLAINAQLALNAAEQQDSSEAQRHLRLMRTGGFETPAVDQALREAADPLRERIQTICKTAEADANADPVHADQVTRRLVDQTHPLLSALDTLLPAGHTLRDASHDEVALCALTCQVSFGNKTENWTVSLELLEMALPVAVSESARERLKENIRIVKDIAKQRNGWCGEGYWELPPSVLTILEKARENVKARRWDDAISILVKLLMEQSEVQIDESGERPIRQALAFCLKLRAVDRVNVADLSDREVLKRAVELSGEDLLLAEELDPHNDAVKENLTQLRRLATNGNVSLGSARRCRIRLGLMSVPELILCAIDSDSSIAQAAKETLERIDRNWTTSEEAKRAVVVVKAKLKDRNGTVRRAAAQLLKKIDPDGAREAATTHHWRRTLAFAAPIAVLLLAVFGRAWFELPGGDLIGQLSEKLSVLVSPDPTVSQELTDSTTAPASEPSPPAQDRPMEGNSDLAPEPSEQQGSEQDKPQNTDSTLSNTTLDNQETINRYVKLGYAFHERAEYDKAIEMFSRVIIIEPDNAEALRGSRQAYEAKAIEERLRVR